MLDLYGVKTYPEMIGEQSDWPALIRIDLGRVRDVRDHVHLFGIERTSGGRDGTDRSGLARF